MPEFPVQQIKDKLDIVEVIGSYLKLQKTGINYRAICPFHSEKKPSFFVSPTRQMFKCFGCNASGSVFDFVMKIEGIEFGDALRILAQKAGVELKTFRPELKTQRQRLYEISELSCQFFEKQLKESSAGKQARNYLLKRGLTEESIKKWRLGYAPDQWQALSDFLIGKGYKREEIIKAGLAVKKETSNIQHPTSNIQSYDRFRGRIIFPVFDLNSQVIGFGGRIFKESQKEEVAKYINIPNTFLYDKSRTLYGLNFAKVDIRKKDCCILTEGYTDVILSHQAGFTNTVATSGTALTPFQLRILKRYTANLLTAFDMDKAGDLATQRGIGLAQKEDFEVRVISLPKDSDPADIISQNPQKWHKLLQKAKEIVSFYFENAINKFDRETPSGKKQIAKFFLPKIKQIPNQILQSHWIQKLANILKVSEEAIFEELKKIIPKKETFEAESAIASSVKAQPKTRKEILEEKIVSLIFQSPQHLSSVNEECLEFFSPKMKMVLSHLKEKELQNREAIDKSIKELEKIDASLKDVLWSLCLRAEVEEEENPEKEIMLCLTSLKDIFTQSSLAQISSEIKKAEEEKNEEKVRKLIEEFSQLAKNLNNKKNAPSKI